jgi:hypothetical protein
VRISSDYDVYNHSTESTGETVSLEMTGTRVLAVAALLMAQIPTHAGASTYRCATMGRPDIDLDITNHMFRMAGHVGDLNEALFFTLTTPLGYEMTFDLGDLDIMHSRKPAIVRGKVSVSKDKRYAEPEVVVCRLQ